MATLYAREGLALGTVYVNESIIGTRFKGVLRREVTVGDHIAVEPIFTGEAYITGMQQCVVDPDDPVKYGFTVGQSPVVPAYEDSATRDSEKY